MIIAKTKISKVLSHKNRYDIELKNAKNKTTPAGPHIKSVLNGHGLFSSLDIRLTSR